METFQFHFPQTHIQFSKIEKKNRFFANESVFVGFFVAIFGRYPII